MTNYVNSNVHLTDISLRYCSCCLKKFSPNPDHILDETVRFFVPTIDAYFRNHFAYVETTKAFLEHVFNSEEVLSINLAESAKILHVEMGESPSEDREKEIEDFYSFDSFSKLNTYNQIAA